MKRVLFVGLLLLTGCSHVAATRGTFSIGPREKVLVLRLTRHVDTVVRGPDSEEDQLLVLEVPRWNIGQRQTIPGDVHAKFSVQRFGPPSVGDSYRGFLIVQSLTDKQVVATLNLVVTASTADNTYKQTARFRGEYTFDRPR